MHIVVRIIGVTTVLVLDKGKPWTRGLLEKDAVTQIKPTHAEVLTYRRLLADRGAGISHRTRRP